MSQELFNLANRYNFNGIFSPELIQALKNTGVILNELQYPSRDIIRQQGIHNDFYNDIEYFLDIKENHLKKRVDCLIQQVKQERTRLIEGGANQFTLDQIQTKSAPHRLTHQQIMIKQMENKQQIEMDKKKFEESQLEDQKIKTFTKLFNQNEIFKKNQIEQRIKLTKNTQKIINKDRRVEEAKDKFHNYAEATLKKQEETEQKIKLWQEYQDNQALLVKKENEIKRLQKVDEIQQRQQVEQVKTEQIKSVREQIYNNKLKNFQENMKQKQSQLKSQNQLIDDWSKIRLTILSSQNNEKIQVAQTRSQQVDAYQDQKYKKKNENYIQKINQDHKLQQLKVQQMQYVKQNQLIEQEKRNELYIEKNIQDQNRIKLQEQQLSYDRLIKSASMHLKHEAYINNYNIQNEVINQKKQERYQQKGLQQEQYEATRQQGMKTARHQYILDFLKLEDLKYDNQRAQRIKDQSQQTYIDTFPLDFVDEENHEEPDSKKQQYMHERKKTQPQFSMSDRGHISKTKSQPDESSTLYVNTERENKSLFSSIKELQRKHSVTDSSPIKLKRISPLNSKFNIFKNQTHFVNKETFEAINLYSQGSQYQFKLILNKKKFKKFKKFTEVQ